MTDLIAALASKWNKVCWKRHRSVGVCEDCLTAALREALEEQQKTIKALMAAVKSLMDEAAGTRATNWKTVNDAMVAGAAALMGRG